MEFLSSHLYVGCDDRKIRVYHWPGMEEVEELAGHDDGIISLSFADSMLYSGSYDHSIRSWDIKEMMQRIVERNSMSFEDVESKKYEVYYGVVFKNKKKKLPAKKKKPVV
jgi:WD40 repeat protein